MKNKQDALEHLGDLVGNSQRHLRRLAADVAQRQQQSGKQHAKRIEAAEESHDDGRKTIARRDLRLQLADHAGHFANAGKARKPARQQEAEHHHPVPRKAGKAPGPRRIAGHLDLKSDERLAHHEGKGDAGQQREQRAEMDGAAQRLEAVASPRRFSSPENYSPADRATARAPASRETAPPHKPA